MPTNFLRHYYDVAQLLDVERVQNFIGTPEYLNHKKAWFRSENQDLQATDAFTLSDTRNRELFTKEYAKTEALYYRGQLALNGILDRIKKDLHRL